MALNFLSNVFEIGFNAVLVRLPEGDYSTFKALFSIFFILAAPITALQLGVGKEVSSLRALNRNGEAKHFALLSLKYALIAGVLIMSLGFPASPYLARFLRIDTVLPVIFMLIVVGFYAAIPVLYGIIQGLKKFAVLGLVTISWGGSRCILSLLVLPILGAGLNGIMIAVIGAVLFTISMAIIPARELFRSVTAPVDAAEIRRAFAFTLPMMMALFCFSWLRVGDVVFIRGFFPESTADAYGFVSTVGAAFFTLSSIFMVMFPTVSHEATLQRNPIRFLLRSMLFTGGLSAAGFAVAWFFPTQIMLILTVGKVFPEAVPLIRVVGFMILPLSLTYLIANYFLAQHIAGFLPILLGGTALQVVLVVLVHPTPLVMLSMVGLANTVTLAGMLLYLWKKHRDFDTTVVQG